MVVDDGCQTVMEQHLAVDPGIGSGGLEGEHEVELMVLKACYEVGHRRLRDVHHDMGVLSQEGGDGLCHDAGEGEGDADVQLPSSHVLQFLEPLHAVVG